MLIDDINEQLSDPRRDLVIGGVSGLDGLRAVCRRLADAALFEVDPDVLAMCVNVSFGKPSSVLAAMPHIALPADTVWIEFANAELRAAVGRAGSPNVPHAGEITVAFERTGFLIRRDGDTLLVEMVTRQRAPDGRIITNTAAVVAYVRLTGTTTAPFVTYAKPDNATGLLAKYFKGVANDPKENGAFQALVDRHVFGRNPEMAPFIEAASAVGMKGIEGQLKNESEDLRRLFDLVALPTLILLTCRNAVDREVVLAPEKLNRARVKAGKAPIRDRTVIRMSLSKRTLFKAARAGDGGREVRAALVIGHFKVRASGVFWWSQHARAGWGSPAQVMRKLTR